MRKKQINIEETLQDSFYKKKVLHNQETHLFQDNMWVPIFFTRLACIILFIIIAGSIIFLQIAEGEAYKMVSAGNTSNEEIIFAQRGIVYDRNNEILIRNIQKEDASYYTRQYIDKGGFGHLLGYSRYPAKDIHGNYYRTNTEGVAGVELLYNFLLHGNNGKKILAKNAEGELVSDNIVTVPKHGESITLSIDSEVQAKVFDIVKNIVNENDYVGGSGIIYDATNGELISLTSYPEYNSEILSNATESNIIKSYQEDSRDVFLFRPVSGLFTPGSVIKPFIAVAALMEDIVDPSYTVNVTGPIVIENPYNEDIVYTYPDWRNHGIVNFERALAVSSNVYFYHLGGGFKSLKGLGIDRIVEYMQLFEFDVNTTTSLAYEPAGLIPSPDWKKETFNAPWFTGDTYNTSIGQYSFQVTPLQLARAFGVLATKGVIRTPTVIKDDVVERKRLVIDKDAIDITISGMREAAQTGTARALNFSDVKIAAKTGTAQIKNNTKINAWIAGFFPYDAPRYVFIFQFDEAEAGTTTGGVSAAYQLFAWLREHRNEVLQGNDFAPIPVK